MQSIVFGGEAREHLQIQIFGYERPATGDAFDDNWLSVEVAIAAGAFRGSYPANFLAGELEEFHRQMDALYASLVGQATFETMEGQLGLRLTGNGLGHIRLEGTAQDCAGIGNTLFFNLEFDQTQLGSSLQSLEDAIKAFPSRI